MKVRPVGVELLHADGRTGMTKLTVVFRNFVNVLKTQGIVNEKMIENITITDCAMRSSSESECDKCQRGL